MTEYNYVLLDINLKINDNLTALHYAVSWDPGIPGYWDPEGEPAGHQIFKPSHSEKEGI